ncbi:hypothetical protein MSIMFB_00160 [Mycobacterium simulans]|uniref:AMP-dependent synthetase/ligase domain-containing protein n=1 Tax=Mycobacterium simulans TaxID=627089 RepID=A0A7Z7IFR0_9MYCO|nr:hypothetical protein [Mycobacterium simulans]SOJ52648.1 hypothetical protein MSIMFB_00160 [Mycobacterium simulans]
MSALSSAVLPHVKAHAPAVATGAVDYPQLLGRGLPRIDFYDTRTHLGTLPGPALAHQIRIRASALAAVGLGPGDRVVMVATNGEPYLVTLLAVLLLGALTSSEQSTTYPWSATVKPRSFRCRLMRVVRGNRLSQW